MVTLRDALRESPVFQTDSCLPPLWGTAQFPLGSQDQSPSQHSNVLLACGLRGVRSPQWAGGSLNVQLKGIIVVSPGGDISPSGTETSGLVGHIAVGTGSRIFASGSLGIIGRGVTLIPTS